jgi:ribonucleoside-triphosphate reductase
LLNLIGRDIATADGQQLAREILEFMRERMTQYQEETGNYYNLEATPAEGTSFRLALKDKERYPDIMVANEGSYRENNVPPYYTNSSHLPVDYTDDPFELLDLQDDLQTKYTGGTVIHTFVGEEISDIESVKAFVRTVCQNYHLPYFTITPTFSICPNHGYIAGKHMTCDKCGAQNEVYSRIVGYIRPIQQWNAGKRAEFDDRNTYKIEIKKKVADEAAVETKEMSFVEQLGEKVEEAAEKIVESVKIKEPAIAKAAAESEQAALV